MNATTANPADTTSDTSSHTTSDAGSGYDTGTGYDAEPQPLTRAVEDRMVAGVAAGFARYLGVDATIVRIVLAVLTVVGGAGVPIYVAGWLLIPEEGHEQSIAAAFIDSRRTRAL